MPKFRPSVFSLRMTVIVLCEETPWAIHSTNQYLTCTVQIKTRGERKSPFRNMLSWNTIGLSWQRRSQGWVHRERRRKKLRLAQHPTTHISFLQQLTFSLCHSFIMSELKCSLKKSLTGVCWQVLCIWVSVCVYDTLHVHKEVLRGVVSMATAGHTHYCVVAGQRRGGSITTWCSLIPCQAVMFSFVML